jgi:tetratricopeptide (TPR) repeat protein
MKRLHFLVLIFLAAIYITGCKTTESVPSFNSYLYPEGKKATIQTIDGWDQRKFDFYFMEATRLKMMGDLQNAISYYREALNIDSTCATCFYELGNILIQNEEVLASEVFLLKAVQLDPTNEEFVSLLSKLYLNLNKDTMALSATQHLLQLKPQNPEYRYQMAQIYYKMKNYNKAIDELNVLEQNMGINENITLEKVSIYEEKNDLKSAQSELVKLIDRYPANSNFRVYLGDFYIQHKKAAQAKNIYDKVLQDDPSNGFVYFSLANFYLINDDLPAFKSNLFLGFENGNIPLDVKLQKLMPFMVTKDQQNHPLNKDDFYAILDTLVHVHPYSAKVYNIYGNFLLDQKDTARAADQFETSLLIDQRQEDVWNQFLIITFQLEDTTRFNAIFPHCMAVYPDNGFFNYLGGLSYFMQKRYDLALNHLNKAVVASDYADGFYSDTYGLIGDIWHLKNNLDSAWVNYDRSLKLNSNNVAVLNNYAYYLAINNLQLDKAEDMINRVIELEPGKSTYLDSYAWILFKKGKFLDALFVIEQAIEADVSESGVIQEHYGDILFKNGEVDKALKYWQKAALSGSSDLSKFLPQKIRDRSYYE